MQHFENLQQQETLPTEWRGNGARTCIFVYSSKDTNAAAHYSGARALLKAREHVAAVYYSTEAITPTTPAADVLAPIDTTSFSAAAEENGDFALWWATPEDPLFSQSPERALLDRWFERMNGYGYLLLSAFANDLGLVDEKKKQPLYALPQMPFTHPLKGPDETAVVLHAAAAEGLFLTFEQSKTSIARRRVLLTLLADFATKFREAIDAKKIPARDEEKGFGSWSAIRDEAMAKEAAGATGMTIHTITVRDGQQIRTPAGRSDSDRAAGPDAPGRDELEFALRMVDNVVARLQKQPVAQSSAETLGQPNVFPVIAVRAGGHVWERQLELEDGEPALAAAARARDEWPGADIVAVLVDAATRDEEGRRTDIFGVKIENAAATAFEVIQRYKQSETGGLELVGRPAVRSCTPFLLAASIEPGSQRPDAELTAFAEKSAADIIAMLTITEPSGIIGTDAEKPLVRASAIVNRKEAQGHRVRFAMMGPLTGAAACVTFAEKEGAESVVYFFDDLVTRDGEPDRRLRLCVQRRGDSGTAIFEQRYEQPVKGKAFAKRGALEFKRWGGPMLAPPQA